MSKTETMQGACGNCIHQRDIPSDCHSRCVNSLASVEGDEYGIRKGWFAWPYNFDPVWLIKCDGFEAKEKGEPDGEDARTG